MYRSTYPLLQPFVPSHRVNYSIYRIKPPPFPGMGALPANAKMYMPDYQPVSFLVYYLVIYLHNPLNFYHLPISGEMLRNISYVSQHI